jgi:trans-aconitate methyltransferase
MTYDPQEYWTTAPPMKVRPAHVRQELALGNAIQHLNPKSILEVGCGWGRVGRLLCALWPDASYTGIDISPDRIKEARERLPERAELITTDLLNFKPGNGYDLVVAVEVLMHVRPPDLSTAISRMKGWANRWVYTLDWTQALHPDDPVAPWNFRYDYTNYGLVVVGTTGRQSIHRWARDGH